MEAVSWAAVSVESELGVEVDLGMEVWSQQEPTDAQEVTDGWVLGLLDCPFSVTIRSYNKPRSDNLPVHD